jgi:hypothetical protein
VVEVGVPGGSAGEREDLAGVAQYDLLSHGVGYLVGVDGSLGVELDHRRDADATVPEQVGEAGQGERADVLDAGGAAAFDQGLGRDVDVESCLG